MKIYMKTDQIQNKINKNPLKKSNSLDRIYSGGLKSYVISIWGGYMFFSLKILEIKNVGKFYFEFAPFSCKFSFLLSFSFLLISWVNCHQIENFQCLNISPGREEFRTHGFI